MSDPGNFARKRKPIKLRGEGPHGLPLLRVRRAATNEGLTMIEFATDDGTTVMLPVDDEGLRHLHELTARVIVDQERERGALQ